MSKHTFVSVNGPNIGDVFEFNLNNGDSKKLPGGASIYVEKKIFRSPKLMYESEKGHTHEITLNENVASGHGVVLNLISSDLFPNDLSKFQRFEGKSSILEQKLDMGYFSWMERDLTPVQKTLVEQIAGSFESYVDAYLKNPMEVIAKQNKMLAEIKSTLVDIIDEKGNSVGDFEAPQETIFQFSTVYDNQHFADAIILNTAIEKALFDSQDKRDSEHYDELQNIDFIVENDCLPGNEFELGNAESYNRFKTTVHKARNANILDLLSGAKNIGSKDHSQLTTALRVYGLMQEKYSENGIHDWKPNISLSLGHFYQEGGECLTKSPTLQIALQEAGVKSRMVRGGFGGAQHKHLWVEADVFEDGTYALVIDPNKKQAIIKDDRVFKHFYHYFEEFNTVWRAKPYK